MKVLIGNAWPYANGSPHIGHLAALLPGDVIARYYRCKGDDVYLVSGSDCYGTPVAVRAKQENRDPMEICNHYHEEFCYCFGKLGMVYDRYDKTTAPEHREFVQDFHRKMYEGEYIFEEETPQAYCETCKTFLADRFVVGVCPDCGAKARGDQCDDCGTVLEPRNLREPVCSVCGATPVFKNTKHMMIAISKMEKELTAFLGAHPHWRKNAIAFTKRYIDEGLRDRAVTRDLDWGIDVPRDGYDGKKIYIWAENVLGYLSMSRVVAQQRGEDYQALWAPDGDAKHYYVHGKDNIPFHTIILPALMIAHGGNWRLPDEIVSCEYVTLEGRKISTSQNWAIWGKDLVDRYHPDSIRYFFITNGPERRDTDFSWREFVNSYNGELLGAYGNFVNRTLAFIYKYFGAVVPAGTLDGEIDKRTRSLFREVGALIEKGDLKEALDTVFEYVRFGNKYFDTEKPWDTRTSDPDACNNTLYNCVQMIANLSILLEPFLPFSAEKIRGWLSLGKEWKPQSVEAGYTIPEPEILFVRLDKKVIDEELERLHQQSGQ